MKESERVRRTCPGDFILEAAIMRLRSGRENRIGTSDMISTPPAKKVSTCAANGTS